MTEQKGGYVSNGGIVYLHKGEPIIPLKNFKGRRSLNIKLMKMKNGKEKVIFT